MNEIKEELNQSKLLDKNEVTVKFINYRIKGVVKLIDWYGQEGFIAMEPVNLNILPKKEELINYLNDNGFGCQKIIGGLIDVWKVYEHNVEILSEMNDIIVGDIKYEELPQSIN